MKLSDIEKFAVNARVGLIDAVDAELARLGFAADALPPDPERVQGGWLFDGRAIPDPEFGPRLLRLKDFVRRNGRKAALERAAYTWFNRLAAIRILERRGLIPPQLEWAAGHARVPAIVHRMRTGGAVPPLSPGESATLAPIRADATRTRDQFAVLVSALCRETPLLAASFGEVDDWTLLLVPPNLLAEGGLVDELCGGALLTDADYASDELIGWLYQYYIAGRKAEVYDGFKRNRKAGASEIPAATQIFTPNWIVKHLVENTLQLATNHSPLTTKFIDPCCGSGHFLLEAFRQLLPAYEELGYAKEDAVGRIFAENVVGVDLDPRARQLSVFALLLAATKEDESFADAHALPRVFDTVTLPPDVSRAAVAAALDTHKDDAAGELADALALLRDKGDTAGSLLRFELSPETRALAQTRLADVEDAELRRALGLVLALSDSYNALATNPPYLGSDKLEVPLKEFLKENYRDGKDDLFAAFILRLLEMCTKGGRVGMITMESWMFISSFEQLRQQVCNDHYIVSLAHFGWYMIGIAFGTTMFVIANEPQNGRTGEYSYLTIDDIDPETNRPFVFPKKDNGRYAILDQQTFSKIPGTRLAFWVSKKILKAWEDEKFVGHEMITREGMATADNDRFLRYWHEISLVKADLTYSSAKQSSPVRWFPYNKGGSFRRWFGNIEHLVNWENNGEEIRNNVDPETGRIRSHNYNGDYAFQEGITWSALSSGKIALRYSPAGFLWDSKGAMGFCNDIEFFLGLLNSIVSSEILEILSPNFDFKVGDIILIPLVSINRASVTTIVKLLVSLSRSDWDEYETSWDFKVNPLVALAREYSLDDGVALDVVWGRLFERRMDAATKMKELEEENNRLFIEAYGLSDELKPDVAWKDVSLTGNPFYRYKAEGGAPVPPELEARARGDAVRELLSYGMGVLMGRYSLARDGLVLASQGETLADWRARVGASPTLLPDEDGIVPAVALEGSFFRDNLPDRMRDFLSAAFGAATLSQNLNFVEAALGCPLGKYLCGKFFDDHAKTYRKKPIYWLFESPKGHFRAFAYLHRMTAATAGLVRNRYLLPYAAHLERRLAAEVAKGSDMTAAERKRAKALEAAVADCRAYDLTLHDLAERSISLDLDDGVTANWAKYAEVLAKL